MCQKQALAKRSAHLSISQRCVQMYVTVLGKIFSLCFTEHYTTWIQITSIFYEAKQIQITKYYSFYFKYIFYIHLSEILPIPADTYTALASHASQGSKACQQSPVQGIRTTDELCMS